MQATQINRPVLKIGSTGEAVKELQKLLLKRLPIEHILKVDGIFGKNTQGAVELFQYRFFLNKDGVVGQKTWQALEAGQSLDLPELRRGSTGNDVTRVQDVLRFSTVAKEYFGFAGYYFGAIDGDFGLKTEEAVKAFQKRQGLVADGVIRAKTWKALMDLAASISHIAL
jgi:peptidoglycan hydrolase-like protein with peptidoglycan-binding domain